MLNSQTSSLWVFLLLQCLWFPCWNFGETYTGPFHPHSVSPITSLLHFPHCSLRCCIRINLFKPKFLFADFLLRCVWSNAYWEAVIIISLNCLLASLKNISLPSFLMISKPYFFYYFNRCCFKNNSFWDVSFFCTSLSFGSLIHCVCSLSLSLSLLLALCLMAMGFLLYFEIYVWKWSL